MRLLLQRYLKDMGNINRGSFKITIVRALQAMTLLLYLLKVNKVFFISTTRKHLHRRCKLKNS